MRVLFTHSYFLQFDVKQVAHAQPYPPLGTILAASLVRNNGYQVSLFDTMFANNPDEIIPALESFKPQVLVVYDDGFNYLTKMCLSNMREAAFQMQHIAKKFGCKVIMTSSDAADHYEKYLANGADFVIIGEAEFTLLQLLNEIKIKSKNFDEIAGIAYELDGKILKTTKRNIKKDLDELPLPAWDLVNIEPYKNVWMSKRGFFSINIATTRGCPYKCNWCAKPIYGNIYNIRSPENVIKEIKLLKGLYNIDHIWFCDDIFGLKASWVQEFSALVKREKLSFKYKIQSRADLLVQENYVKYLAESGCDDVWMGAESGSQKILDAMDKVTTVHQIVDARNLLKQYNIKASFFLQFGYLGETIQDIKLTIELLKQTMPDDIGISISYPLPGTVFYDRVKQDLKLKTNWSDSDELAMMFNNTYKASFYKQLQQYVHLVYKQQQGIDSLKKMFSEPSANNIKRSFSLVKNIPLRYLKKNQLKKIESDATASL